MKMNDGFPNEAQEIMDKLELLSLFAQMKEETRRVNGLSRGRCGQCVFWMKKQQCPREKNVNGWNKGPSMGDLPCDKFSRKQTSIDLVAKRRREVEAFAEKHSFPKPEWHETKGISQPHPE